MDKESERLFTIYFAGIAAMRFHPKNDGNANEKEKCQYAAKIADLMVAEHHKRFPLPKVRP